MQHLISQTILSKETMIKALEEELNQERERRKEVVETFKKQMVDFQEDKDIIQRMQRANARMERVNGDKATSELREERKFEDELDLVPTKDSKSTQRTNPSARSSKSLKSKQIHQSFNPDRVKSSIPKVA